MRSDDSAGTARVRARRAILVLLSWSLLAACTASVRESTPGHEPTGEPMQRVRVLTYNTLHGLDTSGLTVKAAESKEVRQARLDLQFRQLSVVEPDVILLQEVNPLPRMAAEYVAALKGFGRQYTAVHQVDSCGVRLAPGLAVVPGLNNGLVVLAKTPSSTSEGEGAQTEWRTGRLPGFHGYAVR